MQNHKMLSRLLVAALVSLTSVAAVQAADASTSTTAATSLSGPASAPSTTSNPAATSAYADDAMITTMVKAALVEDKKVQALKISVSTEQGVVKMSGIVPNAEAGKRALQLAAGVQGVKDVQSELKVKKGS